MHLVVFLPGCLLPDSESNTINSDCNNQHVEIVQVIFKSLNVCNSSKGGMLIMNALVIISGIVFVISKEIKSYETLLVGRFLTGFIR